MAYDFDSVIKKDFSRSHAVTYVVYVVLLNTMQNRDAITTHPQEVVYGLLISGNSHYLE